MLDNVNIFDLLTLLKEKECIRDTLRSLYHD